MTANLGMLIVVGILVATGVYLLLERSITKMLLGLLLFGNGINILLLTVGGPTGNPPIVGRTTSIHETMADPLAQAMILTAIVITMGIAAFVLALAYRSFTLNTKDDVENDPEDTKVSKRRSMADMPDRDRSDDPVTGEPSFSGDAFDSQGNPIPIEDLKNIEDLECYEDLHEGDFDDDDEPDLKGLDGIDSAVKDTSKPSAKKRKKGGSE
ncbi:Na(+)/H(+) antiporter subunit C [Rhodococcus sp. 14-2470-1b]|jgi:multicomponent Na+:H+ antiporter subunit C|uniref:Na(+)/H(+) antiporter subunit C n=1 Tax=Rhodococcus sp. 14-2470-1b TaxID=2023149 RepID=UPI000B9B0A8F|nr:Na(+)/H(+) antiporter subunit C [Rhodococcus sp. 14-2470-1b]OZF50875.1 Na(+)/H(+) antiporter subunit C [Rhodococcus sp. 14-2470-1b]